MKGFRMAGETDTSRSIVKLLADSMDKGAAGAVLIPVEGPDDTFPWMLVRRREILDSSVPVPPVMSVQGARALASFTQISPEMTVVAVMRPCEARAAIELAKLKQIDMERIILLTMDCPGVIPLSKYRKGGIKKPDILDPDTVRPLCLECTEFTAAGDLCMVSGKDGPYLIPVSEKGKGFMEEMGMKAETPIPGWNEYREKRMVKRRETALESRTSLKEETGGLGGLVKFFSGCIGCRSCRTVCPICYCRLCFIDSRDRRTPAAEHLERSQKSGGARLVSNTLLFHVGRMAHMSLSCVGCGMCEDACPSDIPVGRLTSLVSENTRELFDYVPGSSLEEPLPLNTFRTDELHDYED